VRQRPLEGLVAELLATLAKVLLSTRLTAHATGVPQPALPDLWWCARSQTQGPCRVHCTGSRAAIARVRAAVCGRAALGAAPATKYAMVLRCAISSSSAPVARDTTTARTIESRRQSGSVQCGSVLDDLEDVALLFLATRGCHQRANRGSVGASLADHFAQIFL